MTLVGLLPPVLDESGDLLVGQELKWIQAAGQCQLWVLIYLRMGCQCSRLVGGICKMSWVAS
jgi:hypothetical protein